MYAYTVGRLRGYCDECRLIAEREQKAQSVRRYRSTPEGKASARKAVRDYGQTPNGKVVEARGKATYRQTPKGKAASARTVVRYNLSPKGKANMARQAAKRRERSTDPELLAARVELLHIIKESCAKCKTPYMVTHQIDHIVALCLGGTDDWSNLQPLCIKCHRKKTREDIHKFSGSIKCPQTVQ